ncbi:mitotic checkpoint regulator, MAD2B-interacting-domain-containing protein [Triangularia verruculosa]|uniref:Mitotic checkpoint regulator, MAD2B-interacting-domain-containing protein n=1 Tax=Triangularia verruculosa TaxID=2587418 RepID=A0AAN7AT65_9PEZI|nr:mitotic checkpoint regulator, MAD2B-interacting-domain-containing protein [Triangularia verruculosa]
MGLVDYSDSDSDSEVPQPQAQKPAPAPTTSATNTKKPFQKLIGGSGKIVVNLPTASAADTAADNDEPPAKRAKTMTGRSRFGSFGSFLPPPKKTAAIAASSSSADTSTKTPGSTFAPRVNLKTGAEPAFVRGGDDGSEYGSSASGGGGLNLPAPKKSSGPSIPEGQKPESEVKLVGKPLMFKPLSVARKKTGLNAKKKTTATATVATQVPPRVSTPIEGVITDPPVPPSPQKKHISLFSVDDEDTRPSAPTTSASTGAYEPLFTAAEPSPTYAPTYQIAHDVRVPPPTEGSQPSNAGPDAFAGLSKAARRELFGRSEQIPTNMINFNMEAEYNSNEALRQSGEQQVYNPIRSIAPGKHSLRQVVNMAQNNQSALEDSFAKGKQNKSAAAGRYGWK